MSRPIPKPLVVLAHDRLLAATGGLEGLRDEAALDSALAQPFQTFGGDELYPTVPDKAARYAFGIVADHPFLDGNKRTAVSVMLAYLDAHGLWLDADDDALEGAVISVAGGGWDFPTFRGRVAAHVRTR